MTDFFDSEKNYDPEKNDSEKKDRRKKIDSNFFLRGFAEWVNGGWLFPNQEWHF